MQAGDEIRLIGDPGRRGTFTGRTTTRAGRLYVQIRFSARTEWVPRDQVEVVPEGGEAAIDLLRRGRLGRPENLYRTLAHIWLSGRLANFIYSLDTTETDFYAYQFKPVLKLLHSVNNGILIADEVGLGKTIEAGLIWTELRSRFDFRRLVVVCPAMLRDKWREELRRRFGVDAQICGAPETLETLRLAAQGENLEFCLVASIQGLRPPRGWDETDQDSGPTARLARLLDERAEEESLIDLLVIDEAHYLRNPETQTAELGRLLRRVSQFAILLSATPVHLRSEDLYYLLNLVDGDSFSRRDIFEQILEANQHLLHARDRVASGPAAEQSLREDLERAAAHPLLAGSRQLQRLLEDLPNASDLQDPRRRAELAYRLDSINLLGHAVTRTRKRDVKEWRVLRQPFIERVETSPLERAFYETVTRTVREFCAAGGRHAGFLLVMPQRQMSSCMAAALRSWSGERRGPAEQLYEDLGLEGPDEEGEDLGPLVTELRRRAAELGSLADLERHDSKYERLRSCLQAFLREHGRAKVVVFSYFRPTLEYLRDRLRRDRISCIMLLGGMPDKDEILREFRATEGLSVLLSSEVGSEGIDLEFCWVLVNYDLPWNPMKVEQRIGRLDRIGQESPIIRVWNLLYADTIDDRIYHRLYSRLGIFERALGQLEPILGPHIRRLTEDLLSRQLTPEQEVERIEQTRQALENVRQEEERLEGEAASLVAYGDYILSQVQAARELSRRIRAEDIERHVIDFFGRFYPGCQFLQEEQSLGVYRVELSAEAKNDLARFLRERHAATRTQLTRNQPGPVRCGFHNRAVRAPGGVEETISQFHPLLRFIAKEIEDRHAMEYPAVAVWVRASDIPAEVPPGDYRFAVTRWTVRALRVTEQLWYGAEPLAPAGPPLPDQDAEQLILAAARQGRDWPNARAELDAAREAEAIEQGLLVAARRRYEAFVEELRAQNEDRANLQEQILRNHLQQQRLKYSQIRDRHLSRNNPGLARVQDSNIQKLEARVERELAEIARRRRITESMDEVCVGVIRVDT